MASRNGRSRTKFLEPAKRRRYSPAIHGWGDQTRFDHRGFFTAFDVERMRRDPRITFGLRILYAPLPTVTWEVEGDEQVKKFVDVTLRKLWTKDLPKLFRHVVWGWSGGQWEYEEDPQTRQIRYRGLKESHPFALRPLEDETGELAGVAIRDVISGVTDRGDWVLPPRACWLANEPEFGSLYGRSRLYGAWVPFQEKCPRHGALDVRRGWYLRNAYRGPVLRHPGGVIVEPDGQEVTCQDRAREIGEKFETGGTLTLPNDMDDKGNYEWIFDPPAPHGEPPGVREYCQDLDVEMLEGLGIPPEVAKAADTGSGWAGRSVPFLVYLTSEDQIAAAIVSAANDQMIRPLVEHNFGDEAARSYAIKPKSLVPPDLQEQATQQGGQGAGREAQGGGIGQEKGAPYQGGAPQGSNVPQGERLAVPALADEPPKAPPQAMPEAPGPKPPGKLKQGLLFSLAAYARKLAGAAERLAFTGRKKDKIGRTHCYSEGKHVACHKTEEHATDVTARAGREALAGLLADPARATPEKVANAIKALGELTAAEVRALRSEHGLEGKRAAKAELIKQVTAEAAKRVTEKQAWGRKARGAGTTPEELFATADAMGGHAREHRDTVARMLKETRAQVGHEGGTQLSRNHPAFKGGDHAMIKGFDAVARTMAGRYPEILGAHGYGEAEEGESAAAKLFDYLSAGTPAKMPKRHHYQQALDYLRERGPTATPAAGEEEELPW